MPALWNHSSFLLPLVQITATGSVMQVSGQVGDGKVTGELQWLYGSAVSHMSLDLVSVSATDKLA